MGFNSNNFQGNTGWYFIKVILKKTKVMEASYDIDKGIAG